MTVTSTSWTTAATETKQSMQVFGLPASSPRSGMLRPENRNQPPTRLLMVVRQFLCTWNLGEQHSLYFADRPRKRRVNSLLRRKRPLRLSADRGLLPFNRIAEHQLQSTWIN